MVVSQSAASTLQRRLDGLPGCRHAPLMTSSMPCAPPWSPWKADIRGWG